MSIVGKEHEITMIGQTNNVSSTGTAGENPPTGHTAAPNLNWLGSFINSKQQALPQGANLVTKRKGVKGREKGCTKIKTH